jgi:hypothetical protein
MLTAQKEAAILDTAVAELCALLSNNPGNAVQHIKSGLDHIAADYDGLYGQVRAIYTGHLQKIERTKRALDELKTVNAATVVDVLINFLNQSTNWDKGTKIPFTNVWARYISNNNSLISHLLLQTNFLCDHDELDYVLQNYGELLKNKLEIMVKEKYDQQQRLEQAANQRATLYIRGEGGLPGGSVVGSDAEEGSTGTPQETTGGQTLPHSAIPPAAIGLFMASRPAALQPTLAAIVGVRGTYSPPQSGIAMLQTARQYADPRFSLNGGAGDVMANSGVESERKTLDQGERYSPSPLRQSFD